MLDWSQRDYDEALIILQATNRDKWPLEPDEVLTEHPRPQAQTILDHEQAFWMKFVVDCKLNPVDLLAAGYGPEQIPWLESEMKSLGWL